MKGGQGAATIMRESNSTLCRPPEGNNNRVPPAGVADLVEKGSGRPPAGNEYNSAPAGGVAGLVKMGSGCKTAAEKVTNAKVTNVKGGEQSIASVPSL